MAKKGQSNQSFDIKWLGLGSGTTIIAAEMKGRHCYGLEIDAGYCDVIAKRWQDFTLETPRLNGEKIRLEV